MVSLTITKPKKKQTLPTTAEYEKEKQQMQEPNLSNKFTKVYDTKLGLKDNTNPRGYVGVKVDGELYKGISEEDATVYENIDRRKKLQEYASKMTEAKIAEEVAYQRQKKAYEESTTPSPPVNVTQEQLARIGQAEDISGQPNEITSDIEKKNAIRQFEQAASNIPISGGVFGLNKVLPLGSEIPVAGTIWNKLLRIAGDQNKDVRDWIQDYSNEENYGKIKTEVQDAQAALKVAIRVANQPGDINASESAIIGYNAAISRLNLADAQLKMIGDRDQRKYADDIRAARTKLRKYIDNNIYGRGGYNDIFYNSLLKPNPASYNDNMLPRDEEIFNG